MFCSEDSKIIDNGNDNDKEKIFFWQKLLALLKAMAKLKFTWWAILFWISKNLVDNIQRA